jgi:hypothetical protein
MKAGKFLTTAALNFSLVLPAPAQVPASPPTSQSPAPAAAAAPGAKTFSQQELDQLLAPIALYPDALLAQVLMASTYPLEVVEADRWVKANPKLKEKALEDALQKQRWDPSVKSLAVFPQVLTMMSEKLDWTQKLGDAFLAQQKDVLATAQTLRNKAVKQGTLKDSKEQKVTTETTGTTTVVKIEPTNPEVVYVPTYNPTVVYGSWPYPAYPPYYYYPPGYTAGAAFFGFAAGAFVGAAPTSMLIATTTSTAPTSRAPAGATTPSTEAPCPTGVKRSHNSTGARSQSTRRPGSNSVAAPMRGAARSRPAK